jgi:hypothetical protein
MEGGGGENQRRMLVLHLPSGLEVELEVIWAD